MVAVGGLEGEVDEVDEVGDDDEKDDELDDGLDDELEE